MEADEQGYVEIEAYLKVMNVSEQRRKRIVELEKQVKELLEERRWESV